MELSEFGLKAVYERSSHCQIVEGEKQTERVAEDLEKLVEGQGGIQGVLST